jgi:hypothetical protein
MSSINNIKVEDSVNAMSTSSAVQPPPLLPNNTAYQTFAPAQISNPSSQPWAHMTPLGYQTTAPVDLSAAIEAAVERRMKIEQPAEQQSSSSSAPPTSGTLQRSRTQGVGGQKIDPSTMTPAAARKAQQREEDGRLGQCYVCHVKGHMILDCPVKLDKMQTAANVATTSNQAIPPSVEKYMAKKGITSITQLLALQQIPNPPPNAVTNQAPGATRSSFTHPDRLAQVPASGSNAINVPTNSNNRSSSSSSNNSSSGYQNGGDTVNVIDINQFSAECTRIMKQAKGFTLPGSERRVNAWAYLKDGDTPRSVLCDTGSPISTINISILAELKISPTPPIGERTLTLAIQNTHVNRLGTARVIVDIQWRHTDKQPIMIEHDFEAIDGGYDILLGRDTLPQLYPDIAYVLVNELMVDTGLSHRPRPTIFSAAKRARTLQASTQTGEYFSQGMCRVVIEEDESTPTQIIKFDATQPLIEEFEDMTINVAMIEPTDDQNVQSTNANDMNAASYVR